MLATLAPIHCVPALLRCIQSHISTPYSNPTPSTRRPCQQPRQRRGSCLRRGARHPRRLSQKGPPGGVAAQQDGQGRLRAQVRRGLGRGFGGSEERSDGWVVRRRRGRPTRLHSWRPQRLALLSPQSPPCPAPFVSPVRSKLPFEPLAVTFKGICYDVPRPKVGPGLLAARACTGGAACRHAEIHDPPA